MFFFPTRLYFFSVYVSVKGGKPFLRQAELIIRHSISFTLGVLIPHKSAPYKTYTFLTYISVFLHREFMVWQSLVQFSMTLSLHTVVIIAVERYLFFLKPLFHRNHVTSGRMRGVVLITWCSALLFIPFRVAHFLVGRKSKFISFIQLFYF